MYYFDDIVNSIWTAIFNSKIIKERIYTKDILINKDNKLWKKENFVSSDPVLLIHEIYQSNNPLLSLKRFYEIETPAEILTDKMIMFYDNIVGNSVFLLSNLRYTLNMDNNFEFIIPDDNFIKNNIAVYDKINKTIPDIFSYSGKKCRLIVDGCNVINGAVIKDGNGFIVKINSYIAKSKPLNYSLFLSDIFDGHINLSVDDFNNNSIGVFSFLEPHSWDIPIVNKVNLLNSSLSKVNYVFGNESIFFADEQLVDGVKISEFLVSKVKKKQEADKFLNIIKVMNDYEYSLFIDEIKDISSDEFISKVEMIRLYKPDNVMPKFKIKLLAKKTDGMFASDEVLISINGVYDFISVSEQNRNAFISRADVIKRMRELLKIDPSIDTSKMLNKLFDEIRYKSEDLPSIKEVIYDGVWEAKDKFALVTKNLNINSDDLIESGLLPVGKYVEFNNYKTFSSKQYLLNVLSKTQDIYLDTIYYFVMNMIFKGNLYKRIAVSSEKEAKLLIRKLTESTGFIKSVKFKDFQKYFYSMYNSKVILATITENNPYFLDSIDDICYLGNKKEKKVEFEAKINLSVLQIDIVGGDDDEFRVLKKNVDTFYFNDLIYLILNAKNQKKELEKIIEFLDESF